MNEQYICDVARASIAYFMAHNGYEITDGWDMSLPECFSDFDGHCIITVCGRAKDNAVLDVDELWNRFTDYIITQSSLVGSVKFMPYDLERYDYLENTYIFLAVAH